MSCTQCSFLDNSTSHWIIRTRISENPKPVLPRHEASMWNVHCMGLVAEVVPSRLADLPMILWSDLWCFGFSKADSKSQVVFAPTLFPFGQLSTVICCRLRLGQITCWIWWRCSAKTCSQCGYLVESGAGGIDIWTHLHMDMCYLVECLYVCVRCACCHSAILSNIARWDRISLMLQIFRLVMNLKLLSTSRWTSTDWVNSSLFKSLLYHSDGGCTCTCHTPLERPWWCLKKSFLQPAV